MAFKRPLSAFFFIYRSNGAGELVGRDPQEVGGNPRTELALFLTIETGSVFTELGHFFTPHGCHKLDF